MYCVISKFGDNSIAWIQWAYEFGLKNVKTLSVDTSCQSESWKMGSITEHKWIL